jgi:recombination protein RecT
MTTPTPASVPAKRPDAAQPLVEALASKAKTFEALLPDERVRRRFGTLIISACRTIPALMRCAPASVVLAAVDAAELGLEPNTPLGHGWLIPYGQECKFIPGFKGLVYLLWKHVGIDAWAEVVYTGDIFRVKLGDEPGLEHQPDYEPGAPRGDQDIVAAYAVARLPDNRRHFAVMTAAEVAKVRSRSKSGDRGPWSSDFPEMAKKTALRRLVKMLPIGNDVISQALEKDNEDFDQTSAKVRNTASINMLPPKVPEVEEDAFDASGEEAPATPKTREPGED